MASLLIFTQVIQVYQCDIIFEIWWLSSHLKHLIWKSNQLRFNRAGSRKKQSFIHELLFYITERNSKPSQTSKIELFRKMINCFCGMAHQLKAFSLISSWVHCQRFSPSTQISNTIGVGFKPAQNLSSGLVESSCAVNTSPFLLT